MNCFFEDQIDIKNELIIYPWVGIVANVPVSLWFNNHVKGCGDELRNKFTAMGFNPVRVTPLWSHSEYSCFAVVEFNEGLPGFHCAMEFDKSFKAAGKGKQNYLHLKDREDKLYGWIGREDDFYLKKEVGEFLRKFRDLKTVEEIEAEEKSKSNKVKEENSKSNKLLSNLSDVIKEENMHLEEIEVKYKNNSVSLHNLITQKDEIFQDYRGEIEKMQQNTKVHVQNIVTELKKKKIWLEHREKELQKREALEKNERATLEQKTTDEIVFELAEEHKRKTEELLKTNIELEKQINAKQKALERKEKLFKYVEAQIRTLVTEEHKNKDELQEARKELINFLKNEKSSQWIGVKGMGELDENPFRVACKRKYTGPEAEEKAEELCSLWEDHLRDSNWHPFKTAALEGGDDHKEIIDEEDEKLKRLKAEWGSEVQMAVITALMEMNECNPSGRYIIWELWNHKAGRKATLCEGLSYLLDLKARRMR